MFLWLIDLWLNVASDCANWWEPTPRRNMRRLRKHTLNSNAADTKEHVVDVFVEFKDSAAKGCLIKIWIALLCGIAYFVDLMLFDLMFIKSFFYTFRQLTSL